MSFLLRRRAFLNNEKFIEFTFPNDIQNFKNGSTTNNDCTLYGIFATSNSRNKAAQTGIKAFDMDLSTSYVGVVSSGTAANLAITFPFPIYDLTVHIKNVNTSAESYSKAGNRAAGIKTGIIYVAPTSYNNASLTSWTDEVVFYEITDRSECNVAEAETSYRSDIYSSESYGVKSIFINGKTFGSSTWHVYGEVQITGLVKASDYSNWIRNYNVPTS